MKKTLIALMALAGVACAAEQTITLDSTYTSGTIVVHLNADTLQDIVGDNFKQGGNQAITLFSFNGTAVNPDTTEVTGAIGVASNGSSSGKHSCGLYTSWVWGDKNGKGTGCGLAGLWDNTFDWSTVNDIAVAYSWTTTDDKKTDVYSSVSYIREDGTVTTVGGSAANTLFFSGTGSVTIKATELMVNDTYVTEYTYNNAAIKSVDTLNAMTIAAVTPEPATATLSLLALAGLASRRRRH